VASRRGGLFVSDNNEPRHSSHEKSNSEIQQGEKDMTKLDQMIEEFKKQNPGKGSKKIYGAY
jgi:hypothetical protein